MLSRKITDGCEFIVFDMEWNQPFPGKTYPFDVSTLTGEIIEIGAVKYIYDNGQLLQRDVFSQDIRPTQYKKLHYHVKKVTHKKNSDLMNGKPFEEVSRQFLDFCGPDAILVGWGNSDPAMLKMNLKFFGLDDKLGIPFLDIQPLFSSFSGQRGKQRSVEAAVDYYNIEKNDIFHSATADAHYTGRIFEEIFRHNQCTEVISAISSSSVDPDIRSEFGFVGQTAASSDAAIAGAKGFITACPVCGKTMEAKIPPFRIRKSQYALMFCTEHGEMFSRTRSKRTKNGKYYASSVLRFATQTDYYLVASKKEEFDKFGQEGKPAAEKTTEEQEAPVNL